jgi:exopolysaccharide biosynthesis polyprenyl glycosylphosphotransferase
MHSERETATPHHTTSRRRRAPALRRTRRAHPPVAHRVQGEAEITPAVRRRDLVHRLWVIAADVAAAATVAGATIAWGPTRELASSVLVLPVLLPLVDWANGLYRRDAQLLNKSTLDEAPVIFRAVTLTTVLGYLLASAVLTEPIGAKAVGFIWAGLTLSVPAWRSLARAALRRSQSPERCLVVGDHDHGRRLAGKLLGDSGVNSEMVGVLPLTQAVAPASGSNDGTTALAEAVTRRGVHRVVIAAGTESQPTELEAIQAAKALGVKVSVLPRVLEVVGSSATFDYVDGITLLGVPRFGLSRPARLAKRCFDLAGSAAVLLVAGPVMLAMAAAIKLDSRGPVFFRQTRIGRSGHPFAVLKFRSMRRDADQLKESLRDRNEQNDGLFKIADDPRVTRVGRLLRRTSLDELPQLFCVLRGDMSLVGPRPLVPEEDRQIRGWHRRRLQLTPGMTGPWQVLGSSRIPLHEMVTLDYLYVANWSIWSDAKILLRTVDTVLSRRGR